MTDEREYWRSAIVGRVNEQQPIYAGELLDEIVDLRAQLAEIRRQRDDYYQKMFSENGLVQEVADMAEKGMEAEADLVMLRESHQKLKAFTRNHLRRVHECLKERTALRKRVEALELALEQRWNQWQTAEGRAEAADKRIEALETERKEQMEAVK